MKKLTRSIRTRKAIRDLISSSTVYVLFYGECKRGKGCISEKLKVWEEIAREYIGKDMIFLVANCKSERVFRVFQPLCDIKGCLAIRRFHLSLTPDEKTWLLKTRADVEEFKKELVFFHRLA